LKEAGLMLPDLSIERSTTAERVVSALRKEILTGQIRPGTPLREQDLVKAMGVSRGTVREALSALVSEGLLTRASYRGAVVTQLTEHDVRDLFNARRLIELAAVDAAARATPEQLQPVRAAEQAYAHAISHGTSIEQHEADVRVHTALVDLLESPRTTRMYRGIMGELRLALTTEYDSDDEPLGNRHREFLQFIADDDPAAAKAQLARRIDFAEQRLLASMAQRLASEGNGA
jgi:DNA-binding GntR family transcriptional regulator